MRSSNTKITSGLIRALDFMEIDLTINPIHVNEIRMKMFDVTQPFYVSYIGVATTDVKKTQVGTFLRNFFSFQFFRIVALLILIMFIFGTILWMVERDNNPRQFRPGLVGLFDGLWWSAVTMTTVGYGDKAPKTRLGRIVAIVWMLTAIVTISAFTASIASTLTVQSLGRNIEDLEDMRNAESIGSVYASSSEEFLKSNDIQDTITVCRHRGGIACAYRPVTLRHWSMIKQCWTIPSAGFSCPTR
jgi:polar amino acid transport system substrate-binding protein